LHIKSRPIFSILPLEGLEIQAFIALELQSRHRSSDANSTCALAYAALGRLRKIEEAGMSSYIESRR